MVSSHQADYKCILCHTRQSGVNCSSCNARGELYPLCSESLLARRTFLRRVGKKEPKDIIAIKIRHCSSPPLTSLQLSLRSAECLVSCCHQGKSWFSLLLLKIVSLFTFFFSPRPTQERKLSLASSPGLKVAV